jgi:hypothetical protein
MRMEIENRAFKLFMTLLSTVADSSAMVLMPADKCKQESGE